MSDIDLENDIKEAREILKRLCKAGLVSMRIPAEKNDEDLILSRVIKAAEQSIMRQPDKPQPCLKCLSVDENGVKNRSIESTVECDVCGPVFKGLVRQPDGMVMVPVFDANMVVAGAKALDKYIGAKPEDSPHGTADWAMECFDAMPAAAPNAAARPRED